LGAIKCSAQNVIQELKTVCFDLIVVDLEIRLDLLETGGTGHGL